MESFMQEQKSDADRVRRHTNPKQIKRIDEATRCRILNDAGKSKEELNHRIEELRREWDMERYLETMASTLACFGATMALLRSKRWLLLPMGVTAFLLQHAIQGWCPPVGLFRRLGVRTRQEIDQELYALKALRGDFQLSPEPSDSPHANAVKAIEAVGIGAPPSL